MTYINSFAENIEWPKRKDSYRIQVIADHDDELRADFKQYAKEQRLNEKPIEVLFSDDPSNIFQVDIIYLASKFNSSINEVYRQVRGKPILLITDQIEDDRFIMINFIINENNTTDFELNAVNILNQGLKIFPEVLFLAGDEVDMARLYQEARDSIQIMEERISGLQKRYDSIAFNIAAIQKTIYRQNIKIDEQLDEIYEKQSIINLQSIFLDSLTNVYEDSENRLDSIGQNLEDREFELFQLQKDINNQSKQLKDGNRTLDQQLKLINEQDKEILSREFRLQEMTTIVDTQQITLVYLILFLVVLMALAIFIYVAYRGRKRDAKRLLEQKEELSELVNELHQTQSQLVQSEKMASLGVLTAGIAHEINNAINFVYSGIQILEMKFSAIKPVLTGLKGLSVGEDNLKKRVNDLIEAKEKAGYDELQELIDQIIQNIQVGVERTTEIVKGLRTFSRSEEEERSKIDIHKEIEVALLLLKSRYKDVIKVEKEFTDKKLEIAGYQGQLGQAFLNIINNAIDALDDTGNEGEIKISTSFRDDHAFVSIKDNGAGIPKEIRDRIFDPFFTTKKVGAGTGLGLSITYGIVEKHGGGIDIESKKIGTEFIIKLPLAVA